MSMSPKGVQETVAERLQMLGAKGVLVQMAKNGQILELRCEMPTCYGPNGRTHFDPWSNAPHSSGHDWSPNVDHYPTLKMDGGERRSWNVRLAHVRCNNLDFGWRKRIRAMLEKDPTRSFDAIAKALNKKKKVLVPPGEESWTAEIVRNVYVSLPLPQHTHCAATLIDAGRSSRQTRGLGRLAPQPSWAS
jgi:hypothetical protein